NPTASASRAIAAISSQPIVRPLHGSSKWGTKTPILNGLPDAIRPPLLAPIVPAHPNDCNHASGGEHREGVVPSWASSLVGAWCTTIANRAMIGDAGRGSLDQVAAADIRDDAGNDAVQRAIAASRLADLSPSLRERVLAGAFPIELPAGGTIYRD